MTRQQLWRRLVKAEKTTMATQRRFVVVHRVAGESKQELDELLERWQAGEPIARFGGEFHVRNTQVIRFVLIAPPESVD